MILIVELRYKISTPSLKVNKFASKQALSSWFRWIKEKSKARPVHCWKNEKNIVESYKDLGTPNKHACRELNEADR